MSSFHRKNTEEALRMMREKRPDQVILNRWRHDGGTSDLTTQPHCGTLACMGGWLPWDPHFKSLGIKPTSIGGPSLLVEEDGVRSRRLFDADLSHYLFGSEILFDPRHYTEDGHVDNERFPVSDHALIIHRLEKHLATLP